MIDSSGSDAIRRITTLSASAPTRRLRRLQPRRTNRRCPPCAAATTLPRPRVPRSPPARRTHCPRPRTSGRRSPLPIEVAIFQLRTATGQSPADFGSPGFLELSGRAAACDRRMDAGHPEGECRVAIRIPRCEGLEDDSVAVPICRMVSMFTMKLAPPIELSSEVSRS